MKIDIPPSALEAGARALLRAETPVAMEWNYSIPAVREEYLDIARAAFLAIVEAWEGNHIHEWQRPWLGGMSGSDLILPLPQEKPDDKA